MKYYKKRIVSICMTSAVLASIASFPVSATGVNAGFSASLGNNLAQQTEAYKEAGILTTENSQQSVEICGYKNLGIADVDNHLNIRENPEIGGKLVGKLPKNGACEILETDGEWAKVKSGKVCGYVKLEYLLTGDIAAQRAEEVKTTVATTNTQTVYLRTEPNTECTIWTAVPEGEELVVVEILEDWTKVNLDGDDCYVFSEYVDISEQLPKAMTMTEIRYGEGVSNVRVALINYACQFVGNPYVWGGTSLTRGADCSGFTMRVFENYGIYLPHSASAQSGYGTRVDSSEAKPGDLFFYSKGGRINHVAIYIGNGQVVHASSPRSGIKISNAYYRTPTCVTRLIQD